VPQKPNGQDGLQDGHPVATNTVAVAFQNITKVYPPNVVALDHVSVAIEAGKIHAFVGENGAGKSTLMKVLVGEVAADGGEVRLRGKRVDFASAKDAMEAGIGMVHQEILLVNELTVWENVILGVEPLLELAGPISASLRVPPVGPSPTGKPNRGPVRSGIFGLSWLSFGRIDTGKARASVQASIEEFGLHLDPDAIVGELTVAARQKVEICKLLHRNVDIVILDEPTAVLTPQEIPEFFAELRRLRDAGRTICFISHHLDEVIELCDTITVLRDGAHVATLAASNATPASLARLMVERDVVLTSQRTPHSVGTPVLEMQGLRWLADDGLRSLGPIDLTVHEGEIVGVAGVDGNGQDILVRCITGDVAAQQGSIAVAGVSLQGQSILERRKLLAYVPSERKTLGSATKASITDNTTMTHHRLSRGFRRFGGRWLDRKRAEQFASEVRSEFAVASSGIDQPIGSLSGGNQQKVILGRELSSPKSLIVLDQPTRGLDVGSIEFVHAQILEARANDRAVLLVSADLDELRRLCDRIVVLYRGTIVLDEPNESVTVAQLGVAMLQGIGIKEPQSADASDPACRSVESTDCPGDEVGPAAFDGAVS
jgi:general nucleoside transport system ATP-binding protein